VTLSDFIGHTLTDNPCGGAGLQISSVIGTFTVGSTIEIWAAMELGAGAFALAQGPSVGNGTVNALDTGLLTIESLTPGASFTTASGADYSGFSVAVPEPSTLPLLLTAFAVLGILEYRGRAFARRRFKMRDSSRWFRPA
jgi:hypothetical protein